MIFAVMLVRPALGPAGKKNARGVSAARKDSACDSCLGRFRDLRSWSQVRPRADAQRWSLYLTGVGDWQICVSLLFVFGEARTCFGEMTGDHEEDGISQAGHMVSGVLGVFFYVCVLQKILPKKENDQDQWAFLWTSDKL